MPINRNILKSYAPAARLEFIQAVTDRASVLGLSEKKIDPVEVKGDVAIIAGRPFPKDVADRRQKLEARIKLKGFTQVMEEVAYTWFNRFTALRYMELHDYLGHGYRVLSNPSGSDIPEILEKATSVDLPGLDKDKVAELRLAGDKDAELYNMLLVKQCNALHRVMPKLFESVNGPSELLLPENLLQTNSPIRKLVNDIPEENWSEIEIVGWLYQFYISEKKDQVIGKVVKSEDIPAATQLFTPNWIVKYMVQNTLGRKWLMTYPASAIKGKMEFYIEPAEQEPEVQAKLDAITPKELNPEELTFMDPACGSGHILAEAYDLFKDIYLERGYRTRDIPRLILEKNLYGLDIDDRAAQLARFTVLMKARADDRRILDPENPTKLNIMAIQESKGLGVDEVASVLLRERVNQIGGKGAQQLSLLQPKVAQASLSTSEKPDVTKEELYSLLHLFEDGKTFGSLLTVHGRLKDALPRLDKLVSESLHASNMESRRYAEALLPLVKQTFLLSEEYDFVVANPPFLGGKGQNKDVKEHLKSNYNKYKSDLFSSFIARIDLFMASNSLSGIMTPFVWMFISSHIEVRNLLLNKNHITTLVKPSYTSFFDSAIVPICAFVFSKLQMSEYNATYFDLEYLGNAADQPIRMKAAIDGTRKDLKHVKSSRELNIIPGYPVAFWATDKQLDLFKYDALKERIVFKEGITTGNNDLFLRQWFEVSRDKIRLPEDKATTNSDHKWIPYNKGGAYRKWYGNNSFVILWEKDGSPVKNYKGSSFRNPQHQLREGGTFSAISSSNFGVRYSPKGFAFDSKGTMLFAEEDIKKCIAYLNSNLFAEMIKLVSPTMDFRFGTIQNLPMVPCENISAEELIQISKDDWDAYETSWDFVASPLTTSQRDSETLSNLFRLHLENQNELAEKAASLEAINDKNIRSFVGLPLDENSETINIRHTTLSGNLTYRYGDNKTKEECALLFCSDTMRELISYTIGCMMGRYSLDEPGLTYAQSGNEGFDPSRYATFPADEDGIVPVMDDDWFEDDATSRFVEFLKVAWSPETLDENLKFVADSLEPKRGEAPLDTIRRFISQKFFKDHHLKVYKKRPIYWLFSSGKQRAFECLVYLHRYNENTLARMRAMYVTPLQGKYNARIEYLEKELPAASSTSAAKKLQKELDTMRKKQQELREFDELLRHYADQRISLDLDDGVKVNYGKFGSLLAYVKDVTGEKPE